ncbi:MAG: cysteine desulfurase NifS [Clostridiales bacterium]|jgi:cysteine desulfurase|nr:cysteine desulfurase NifS [Clostridiales bacterium]
MRRIYLDHAATTPVDKAVLADMLPYFSDIAGNANSLHSFGREGAYAVDTARRQIAADLGVKPTEIYFTSGGTEADNWAVKGIAALDKNRGGHLITSKIEHHAVLCAFEQLEKQGYAVTYLDVDGEGLVSPEALEREIRPDTFLVSVMLANNEIGTIQPIRELCEIAHRRKLIFHTDAVQAIGSIPVNITALGVDMLSFSAHKFYGPKGIGVLYIKSGIRPDKLIAGGHQERSRRGGTTNVPSVVGLAAALRLALENLDENAEAIRALRDSFVKRVEDTIPHVVYNGSRDKRLPGNASFSFAFIEGESLLLNLDLNGIACSSGSACSSASLEPSHVLLATGLPIELAHGSIRFSFGKSNTSDDVAYTVEKLTEAVKKLREMSPLFAVIEHKGEGEYV